MKATLKLFIFNSFNFLFKILFRNGLVYYIFCEHTITQFLFAILTAENLFRFPFRMIYKNN